ncbi:isopenicillin N synthase family dioxygenase [Variovorax ginsengisoli]|uniref:2-oxoglutarate-dependent ethylene/succinate-forming enzyme n=1 Tax=Variovorax ginsengisoli TaxID=363844 RepID=A0ABT8SFQ4_9BURK|nr:2-oxoglutarate and iron-dependent oxygenase domain-containing protein [Variovorax ginsengisoli]MDN8618591.1 2-oxoglutarate and iron-dependent oxygenase domain-containing protein [Variovorax ginsengisoli]MDO1537761.1 2-oxoglutarate and iron-dependent oxygenase domain-containing protein [Variovorax ginsengisoli]
MLTDTLAPTPNPIRHDAPEEIPVLDLGPYLRGDPGALHALGKQLGHALENVGFYFIVNHGIEQALIDRTFAAARRFHAQPVDEKLKIKLDSNLRGYEPLKGSTTRHSAFEANNRPNLNEAFFIGRDLAPDHPDVLAGRPFRGLNQWPDDLPGFREDVLADCRAAEKLGLALVPVYAVALGVEPGFLMRGFEDPMFTFRMSHYPQTGALEDNEFSLAPHADMSFMTLLPDNEVPGLSIRLPNGRWIDAPAMAGSFLVNGGDLLRRYTNDRFLATPHKVLNRSGVERYAIPFFMDCSYDFVMECLPTCRGEHNPARYEPISYAEFRKFYRRSHYGNV